MRNSLISLLLILAHVFASGQCCAQPAENDPPNNRLPFRISKETTHLTEPLTESGLVDYAAYLNREMSKGVTPETNAAVLYWKANGKTWDDPEFHRKLIEALGSDPFADGGPYLVPFDQVYKEFTGLTTSDVGNDIWEEYNAAQDAPWKPAELPAVKRFLERNAEPLKTVLAATRRPHYYRPFVSTDDKHTLTEMLLVVRQFQQHRDMARLLKARAMLALGEDRPEDAIRDLLAIHRLARHSTRGGSMIEMLVGIAIESLAHAGDQHLASSEAATADQLTGYAKQLSRLPPLVDIERCFRNDRFFSLDLIQKLASQLPDERRRAGFMSFLGVSSFNPETIKKLAPLLLEHGLDWNKVLVGYNTYYDRIQTAVEQEQYTGQAAAIEQLVAEHRTEYENLNSPASLKAVASATPARRGAQMTTILQGLIGPAMEQSLEAVYRARAKADLSRIGVAVSACQKQHGEFPEALDALVPHYLSELPDDPYTGKPFVYRIDDEGALLYSLGKNLKDDGGKTVFEDYMNHDHVFRVEK